MMHQLYGHQSLIMDKKIEVIKEIVKFHPGLGADKGYSWYEGGMRDTGGWKWDVMIDKPLHNLEEFLEYLKEWKIENDEWNKKNLEEYGRVEKLSKDKQDLYYKNKYEEEKQARIKWMQEFERKLWWGV